MKNLKVVLKWCKDHIVWILGGLVAALATVLAISHEKAKVKGAHLGKQMTALKAEKTKMERLRTETTEAIEENDETQKRIRKKVQEVDVKIEEVRREAHRIDDDEVVARFNRLYGE